MNKEEGGRVELRVGLAYGHWLTGYIVFLVKESIYREPKVI